MVLSAKETAWARQTASPVYLPWIASPWGWVTCLSSGFLWLSEKPLAVPHHTAAMIATCLPCQPRSYLLNDSAAATAAAKSLQSCPTLCDPIDGSPPGSPVPGILQARTLEWVAISFSNVWKWSRSVVSNSSRPNGLQPTRLLHPWDFPGKSTGVGCH